MDDPVEKRARLRLTLVIAIVVTGVCCYFPGVIALIVAPGR